MIIQHCAMASDDARLDEYNAHMDRSRTQYAAAVPCPGSCAQTQGTPGGGGGARPSRMSQNHLIRSVAGLFVRVSEGTDVLTSWWVHGHCRVPRAGVSTHRRSLANYGRR